ncbi:uncharacterized protein ACHE_50605S [Aspergillus chevalieri]|uniref:Uncharacterized protein n=1 Tax=Aspergillus chevalieri TaxID=182096 RepID=A0A7R7VRJ6_ASPCH|nr:uncharacterized protein ACHE_50605S [Aspergillus chevalieri]BCR89407.1 hypothetical protein ACHE_50605S [Aspergillus chevalieri]
MDHIFINIKEPSDALQLAKKTTVRSHVARRQWKAHAETNKDRKRKREEYLPFRIELDCSGLMNNGQLPQLSIVPEGEDENHTAQTQYAGQTTTAATFMLPSIPMMIGGLRVDPFRSYPIEFRSFLPYLVDHYLVSMAVDIPELDQPGNRGLLRTRWFPLVMTEPSLFLVIMLIAASHYASVQHNTTELRLNLLSMRGEAVQSINQSLAKQYRTINDALVGAIAKMASYEAMFGNVDTYGVHMQGLRQIVNLRGGLDGLGLGGLLRRIVVWIDRNGAFLNGSMLYFPGATFVPGQPLPDPNPGHFLGAS